ncbi:MAG: hypothetical protein AAGF84_01735 [Planctomycetota bacterium]
MRPSDANGNLEPRRSAANTVRILLVPLLMVLVAAGQLVAVHFDGLSSWRGGGFGMYAGFHPRHHDAWLFRADTGEAFRYEKSGEHNTGPFVAAIRPVLTYANPRRLDAVLGRLPEDWQGESRLEVWRLQFEPSTGLLTRRLVVAAGTDRPGDALGEVQNDPADASTTTNEGATP